MRSMTLLSGGLLMLSLLLLPLPGLAKEAASDPDSKATDPPAAVPFWPAWNRFFSEITQGNLATNPDPWETMNRKFFAFNDVADRWLLKPVARGYQWITPDPVEQGIGNVFANLFEITTIVNDLLQFKFAQAASDSGRFVVNTTVGLVGIFDVASPIGLEKHDEDFGQTLGYWGVGSGPYLVVPVLGSYTLRSGTGAIAESQSTDFLRYYDHMRSRNQVWLVRQVDRRASVLAAEELITGDRYTFIRDAYLQHREFLVNDGVIEDPFGEEDYDENWEENWDQ